MMTGNDLKRALEIVLDRTMRRDGSMPWFKAHESAERIELESSGIAGYRVKVIEHGRSYDARIAEVSPDGRASVVGAITERLSVEDRSEIERLAFAIFREAIERAESKAFQDFEAAATRGKSQFDEHEDPTLPAPTEREVEF